MKQVTKLLLALMLLGSIYPAMAAKTIAREALSMDNFGKVELLRIKKMEIVINDTQYSLSTGTVTKSATGARIPISYFQPGSKVAFAAVDARDKVSHQVITELWLLPGNFKLPQPE